VHEDVLREDIDQMQGDISASEAAFRAKAQQDGFCDPIQKMVEADRFNAPHSHDETLFLFIQAGQLTVDKPEGPVVATPGNTITVAAGLEHTELAGPDGATILVTRR
jgi:hypothetical protein|tara:strand:- start:141 stop:461 length:321 start_codon:yes stop_codon:yes gene_type:complete